MSRHPRPESGLTVHHPEYWAVTKNLRAISERTLKPDVNWSKQTYAARGAFLREVFKVYPEFKQPKGSWPQVYAMRLLSTQVVQARRRQAAAVAQQPAEERKRRVLEAKRTRPKVFVEVPPRRYNTRATRAHTVISISSDGTSLQTLTGATTPTVSDESRIEELLGSIDSTLRYLAPRFVEAGISDRTRLLCLGKWPKAQVEDLLKTVVQLSAYEYRAVCMGLAELLKNSAV
ncbi:hypothetical protein A0H81_08235 [Grifola frondosa]|uniref:Uncharacterized protein n=1 Tax=Grifola frondosa TaxID=5627 RepID=A0A1C7M4A9_GRIFR|nr:hypothetical protein A0H81_08235 [Grifola frondosa]